MTKKESRPVRSGNSFRQRTGLGQFLLPAFDREIGHTELVQDLGVGAPVLPGIADPTFDLLARGVFGQEVQDVVLLGGAVLETPALLFDVESCHDTFSFDGDPAVTTLFRRLRYNIRIHKQKARGI